MIVAICACDERPRLVDDRRDPHCRRCGGEWGVLLTADQNNERVSRGISIAAWFAAPKVPPTRAGCETRDTAACPYLRCRHHLGATGRYACAIEVAEDASTSSETMAHHTLDHVGKQLNIGRERVRQLEAAVLVKVRKRTRNA